MMKKLHTLVEFRSGSMEQHFLNVYFEGRITVVPHIFNTPARFYYVKKNLWTDSLRVVHYIGVKPWELDNGQRLKELEPVYSMWFYYLRDTYEFLKNS